MLDPITRNLFISYAREDKPIADTLYAYLKPLIAQGKLRVFIDTEEIEKGEEWHKKITGQLHQADAFLFLVSQHYFRSNYVIDTELPAILKRYREDQVACWPFLVSDYPWDDFVIDGFRLAGIQAIGPFDGNKRLIPLSALPAPDQDSQFRHVYTEVREWIDKLEREETQKQEALARQQEQKEREERHRLEQEEEQRKQREHQESEGKRHEKEKPSSAAGPGSEEATSAPSFRYPWLVIFGLIAVVLIYLLMDQREPVYQEEPVANTEPTRRMAREEAEAKEWDRAATEAAYQRQTRQEAELFDRAARQINADRLTYPPGDNALESIRQAQEIQPDNARARELLEAILERYLQLAQGAMVEKEFDKGQQYLDKARQVDASSSNLAEVQNELDAAQRQAASALSQPETGSFRDTLSSGGKGPEMILIPAGSFMMGSPDSEQGRDSSEGPKHKVQIRSFALGKTEVTFDEYDRFAEATGSERPDDSGWGRGDRPVINVSWEDATAYATWLTQQTGKHYRLPSEAEWEYAARAGTKTERYWPNPTEGEKDTACKHANVFDRQNVSRLKASYKITWDPFDCGDDYPFSAPVGQFTPNDWQLHDVLGNVWEWVQDCYVDSYQGAPSDGTPSEVNGTCEYRVMRGGSWYVGPRGVRSANRSGLLSDYSGNNVGFRLARTN